MTRRSGPGCGCLGCGGSSLLVLALLGALAWFFVIKPARDFIAGWQTPQTQTQTQTGQNPAQTPAPTGNENAALTRADVEKFVRVRRKVSAALGGSFTDLQQVWVDIQNGQNPNIMQVVAVLQKASGSIGAARTAQASALTAENMSLERYATVRSGVNRALGLPNIDFAKVADSLQKGQLPDLNTTVQAATEQETQLVAPFKNELMKTAAAGLLGL